jgi:hypothetical protein
MIFKNIFSFLLILILSFTAFSQSIKKPKKAEIFVLSTLHQFHAESRYYSFETLSQIIEKLRPDILAVELTPSDLANRREQKTKQEYQKSIFPLVDKHKYSTVPLEPSEPKFSELVSLIRDSEKTLREKSPAKAEAFSLYVETLYEYLFKTWDSPPAVNSTQTDAFFEIKHNYQNAVYDENQKIGWEGWNTHFLEKILEAAKNNPGKRIVVTVGAEHAYWLRKNLRENKSVACLEADSLLR